MPVPDPRGVPSPALSLVVIARDEADRIGGCLSSVPDPVERIVVDSGSTDGTARVARAHGARVVRAAWRGYAGQRNLGAGLARGAWILFLDADERLSPEAAAALADVLRVDGGPDGLSWNCCTHWAGRPIRHGRWYPDPKVRAVRRGRGRWVGEVHERLEVRGEVAHLPGDILHHPYRNLAEHLETMDRYSQLHAEALAREGVVARWWDVALRPPLHFVNGFLWKRGYRDGPHGAAVAALGAAYVGLKWSRVRRAARRR